MTSLNVYQPHSEATQRHYDNFLLDLKRCLPPGTEYLSSDMLARLADDALNIICTGGQRGAAIGPDGASSSNANVNAGRHAVEQQQAQLERLLGLDAPLTREKRDTLLRYAERITDYVAGEPTATTARAGARGGSALDELQYGRATASSSSSDSGGDGSDPDENNLDILTTGGAAAAALRRETRERKRRARADLLPRAFDPAEADAAAAAEEAADERRRRRGADYENEEEGDGSDGDGYDLRHGGDMASLLQQQQEAEAEEPAVSFEEVTRNPHYLRDALRRLFPAQGIEETEETASQVLGFLSEPTIGELVLETQLSLRLSGYESEDVMKWISAVSKGAARWRIVYGLRYGACAKEGERARVMAEMRRHALQDPQVAQLYQSLTGTDAADFTKAVPRQERAREDAKDEGAGAPAGQQPRLRTLDLAAASFKDERSPHHDRLSIVPPGTQKLSYETHDEVVLPPSASYAGNDPLVDVGEAFAPWAQSAFAGVEKLNPMQSRVYPCAFKSDENMLVSAPTGAGKTNVAMMAMLRTIEKHMSDPGDIGSVDLRQLKMVYVAPMKALVQEVVRTFGERLARLGLTVAELSGDSSMTQQQMLRTQLLVTTPEKWDIITRKSVDLGVASLLKLLIIDEVHLLHNERGPVLEAIVARTLLQQQLRGEGGIRLVGLSATLPNYKDVAVFLKVHQQRGLFCFDSTFRPVPLQQTFCAFRQERGVNQVATMNQITYDKVLEGAESREQTMIFVHSRRETEFTANYLAQRARSENVHRYFVRAGSESEAALRDSLGTYMLRPSLQTLLPAGFAIHHAGLSKEERQAVEVLFAQGHVRVLVCTSTLAWGVNLPANRVIIKGTRVFNGAKGETELLSALDVLQMFGRAGRVGFGSTLGRATIITSAEDLHYYLCVLNQQLPIESQLVKRVVDMLNAEITLGHVETIEEGVQWLRHTYLYVRMRKAPELYRAPQSSRDPQLLHHLANIVHTAATELQRAKMVVYDEQARRIKGTAYGRIASYCYVTAGSMLEYLSQLSSSMQDVGLFRVFAHSTEFNHITVRAEERAQLLELSHSAPVAVQEPFSSHLAKINILLQCYISNNNLEGLPLMSEMVYIKDSAQRILRALFEICLVKNFGDTARRFLQLYLMVLRRQWSVQSPVRQVAFSVLSAKDAAAVLPVLEKQRRPWEELRTWSATDLAVLFNDERRAAEVRRCFDYVPHYTVSASVRPLTRAMLYVDIDVTPEFTYAEEINGRSARDVLVSIELPHGRLLHHEVICLPEQHCREQTPYSCPPVVVPVPDPKPTHLLVRASSLAWLTGSSCTGAAAVSAVSLLNMELPAVAPPLRETAERADAEARDVQAALERYQLASVATALFPFDTFSPMQHELLEPILGRVGESVFVGAPPGSGKTALAELFICQFLQHRSFLEQQQQQTVAEAQGGEGEGAGRRRPHVVYVTAQADVAERHYLEWRYKFGEALGERVLRVTRATAPETLASAAIWVATARELLFHVRRPDAASVLGGVSHIIADHLHLIRSPEGKHLEECLARLHAATTPPFLVNNWGSGGSGGGPHQRARLLALAYPLISSAELGRWLKIPQREQFSYGPSFRALQVIAEATDLPSPAARCEGAVVSAFKLLRRLPYSAAPCVLFVPRGDQAARIATRLLLRCRADCLADPEAQEREWAAEAEDARLGALLVSAVGYLHRGTSARDVLLLLERLERPARHGGQVLPLVLVCSFDAAGRLPAAAFAHAVVCCAERAPAADEGDAAVEAGDCGAAELLCMVSRAGQTAVVYCRTPRRWAWARLLNDPLPLEPFARDPQDFCESINAAVAQGVAGRRVDILRVLQSHYFLFHVRSSPAFYGIQQLSDLPAYASEVAALAVQELRTAGCLEPPAPGNGNDDDDDDDDDTPEAPVRATARGRALAAHAVSLDSLAALLAALRHPPQGLAWTTVSAVWRLLAFHTRELEAASLGDAVRVGTSAEGAALRRLAQSLPDALHVLYATLPFSPSAVGRTKAFVLVLAHCARAALPADFAVRWREDLAVLLPAAQALAAAAVELLTGDGGRYARQVRLLMHLSQCLQRRVWSHEDALRQLPALLAPEGLPATVTLAGLQAAAHQQQQQQQRPTSSGGGREALLLAQAAAIPSVESLAATASAVPAAAPEGGPLLRVRVEALLRWWPAAVEDRERGSGEENEEGDRDREEEAEDLAALRQEQRRTEEKWWVSLLASDGEGSGGKRLVEVAVVTAEAVSEGGGGTHRLAGEMTIPVAALGEGADLRTLRLSVACTSVAFRVDMETAVQLCP